MADREGHATQRLYRQDSLQQLLDATEHGSTVPRGSRRIVTFENRENDSSISTQALEKVAKVSRRMQSTTNVEKIRSWNNPKALADAILGRVKDRLTGKSHQSVHFVFICTDRCSF